MVGKGGVESSTSANDLMYIDEVDTDIFTSLISISFFIFICFLYRRGKSIGPHVMGDSHGGHVTSLGLKMFDYIFAIGKTTWSLRHCDSKS